MRIRFALFVLTLTALSRPPAQARPLFTEEVPTVGKKSFEASLSMSKRNDVFGTPENLYTTVNTPLSARIGLHRAVDLGFTLNYVSQRLETQNAHFTGSQNGRFSPFLKVSPWNNVGFQVFWHTKSPEQGAQNLPVARGEDFEALLLLKLPVAWPVSMNVGYVARGNYMSKLGITNDIAYKIEPGDLFEAKAAVEVPVKFHFSLLGELATYSGRKTRIQNAAVPDSAAEAMDGLVGLTWAYGGWNIGAGAAFGLLEERHSSFDVERGAGDVLYKLTAGYRLVPRRRDR